MAPRATTLATFGLLALLFTGCSEFHYPVNERLYHPLPQGMGYRFENLRSSVANTNSLVVCVSFSGGGARAGAMAYGVVRALAETQLDGGDRSLLDEVDVIAAASGGSFPAAYLAAFGPRAFLNDFREQVLFRDLGMATFWRAALCPYNLIRICSPWFNRSDLAEEVYEGIFGTKTYADLHRQGRPFVVLNATDMIQGTRFEFTQDQFDGLRSSLGRVSLTRAVAASSAFPILLTPVAFRDNTYEDSERYVHLIDGGIVDNLGLGHVLDSYRSGAIRRLIRAGEVGTLVFVVVNARNRPLDEMSESPQAPGAISVLSYGLGAAIDRQTDAQFELLSELVREETKQPNAPRVHLIEVDLDDLVNPARRTRLLGVETTFGLDEEVVDELADASSQLLRQNPSFVELLDVLR
jgi:NTE family protein